MKSWKNIVFIFLLVIIIFAFIGCGDDKNNDSPKVTREFNDLTFLGKNIKLIDETGNANDLKVRGIWQKINDGLNASTAKPDGAFGIKFYTIYAIGNFAIVINSGEDFLDYYSFSDHKVIFRENQVLEYNSGEIIGCIEAAILHDMKLPD